MCSGVGYNVPQIARVWRATYNDAAGQRRALTVFQGEQRPSHRRRKLQPGEWIARRWLIVPEGP